MLNVIERGDDRGPAVVLLHGFELDHRVLLPLDAPLATAGAGRRLYLDLPGHGRSTGDGVTSADDVVAAVRTEIDRRVGDEPIALVGQSFGGAIARRVAHDLGDRLLGLALIVPALVLDHSRRDVPAPTVLRRDPDALEALGSDAADYAELAVVQSHDQVERYLEQIRPGLLAGDTATQQRIADRYVLSRDSDLDTPPAVPTLVITARQDQVVGYRDALRRFEDAPRSSVAVLDAAGHNLLLEQQEVVAALVSEWMRRVGAAG